MIEPEREDLKKKIREEFYDTICRKEFGKVCGDRCPFFTATCEKPETMLIDRDYRKMQRAIEIVKSGNIPAKRKEW